MAGVVSPARSAAGRAAAGTLGTTEAGADSVKKESRGGPSFAATGASLPGRSVAETFPGAGGPPGGGGPVPGHGAAGPGASDGCCCCCFLCVAGLASVVAAAGFGSFPEAADESAAPNVVAEAAVVDSVVVVVVVAENREGVSFRLAKGLLALLTVSEAGTPRAGFGVFEAPAALTIFRTGLAADGFSASGGRSPAFASRSDPRPEAENESAPKPEVTELVVVVVAVAAAAAVVVFVMEKGDGVSFRFPNGLLVLLLVSGAAGAAVGFGFAGAPAVLTILRTGFVSVAAALSASAGRSLALSSRRLSPFETRGDSAATEADGAGCVVVVDDVVDVVVLAENSGGDGPRLPKGLLVVSPAPGASVANAAPAVWVCRTDPSARAAPEAFDEAQALVQATPPAMPPASFSGPATFFSSRKPPPLPGRAFSLGRGDENHRSRLALQEGRSCFRAAGTGGAAVDMLVLVLADVRSFAEVLALVQALAALRVSLVLWASGSVLCCAVLCSALLCLVRSNPTLADNQTNKPVRCFTVIFLFFKFLRIVCFETERNISWTVFRTVLRVPGSTSIVSAK